MKQAKVVPADRKVVGTARSLREQTGSAAASMELNDGRIITGKTKSLLGPCSSVLLNAVKVLGGINDAIDLISPTYIEPIQVLKTQYLGSKNPRLHTDEVLIALSMCAVTNPTADLAMEQLSKLKDAQVHSTVILSQVDETVFKKLGAQVTYDAVYERQKLYHK